MAERLAAFMSGCQVVFQPVDLKPKCHRGIRFFNRQRRNRAESAFKLARLFSCADGYGAKIELRFSVGIPLCQGEQPYSWGTLADVDVMNGAPFITSMLQMVAAAVSVK